MKSPIPARQALRAPCATRTCLNGTYALALNHLRGDWPDVRATGLADELRSAGVWWWNDGHASATINEVEMKPGRVATQGTVVLVKC